MLSLWGIIITSSICLRQTDLKSLITYSSVSHIALVIVAVIIQTPWSYMGATALIIAHGLTSSILFCLANSNYKRIHSRTIILARGLQTFLLLFIFPLIRHSSPSLWGMSKVIWYIYFYLRGFPKVTGYLLLLFKYLGSFIREKNRKFSTENKWKYWVGL